MRPFFFILPSDREHDHHHEACQHRRSPPCALVLSILPSWEVRPEEHERYRSDDRDYHRDLDRDVRSPVLSLWVLNRVQEDVLAGALRVACALNLPVQALAPWLYLRATASRPITMISKIATSSSNRPIVETTEPNPLVEFVE